MHETPAFIVKSNGAYRIECYAHRHPHRSHWIDVFATAIERMQAHNRKAHK